MKTMHLHLSAIYLLLLFAGAGCRAQAVPMSAEVSSALQSNSHSFLAPTITVPPCQTPPVIDGNYDPKKWQDACELCTLSEHQAALAFPMAQVYFTYDANNFYFGYYMPKDKPGWFTANSRFHDSTTYLDKHVELFLSPDPGSGPDRVYQFCINAYGAVYDILNIPAYGQTTMGYNPKINFKTSETQDHWYLEGSIDIHDLDPQGRFRDGATWRANFCWAWPQISWSSADMFWIQRKGMGYFKLNSQAPALQWVNAYPLQEGQLDITAALKNLTGQQQSYQLQATVFGQSANDTLATATQAVTLAAGERREIKLQGPGSFTGRRGHVLLTCCDADGKLLYQQVLSLSGNNAGAQARLEAAMTKVVPLPRTMDVSCRYGPLTKAVEAQADVWFLRRNGTVPASVRMSIVDANNPARVILTQQVTTFQKDLAMCRLQLPDALPYGKYLVKAEALDKNGAVITSGQQEFTHVNLQDPAVNKPYQARDGHILDWIGTKSGVATSVPPPWTPIQGSPAGGLKVLLRDYQLDGSGLPKQIISVGKPLLAGPVRYVAVVNGQEHPLTPSRNVRALQKDPAGLTTSWQGEAKGQGLTLTSKGTLEYDGYIGYELTVATNRPLTLDALYLDIPLANADRINLPASTLMLSGGAGQIWESKNEVNNELMNTLVSHVWLGNWQAGLSFVADQTKGWYEQMGRSLETVVRDSHGIIHLRVYFVQGPAAVSNTKLSYALLATPFRTRDAGWRSFPYTADGRKYFWLMSMCDDESKGFEQVNGGKGWDWDDVSKDELERIKTQDHEKYQQLGLPYTNPWFHYPFVVPWELANLSPVAPIMLEEWANMPSRWGFVRPVASYRDYMLYNYEFYFKQKHYAGFYIDEAYGAEKEDINLLNGSGWFDRDGNLRGSYHSIDVRELFKRQYELSLQYSPTGKPFMYNHASWGISPQYMSHVNCAVYVENLPIGPGESYLDYFPLSTLQFWSGRMWGNFSCVTSIGPDQAAHRFCTGQLLLHDIVDNTENNFRDLRKPIMAKFDLTAPEVNFIGYWEEPVISTSTDEAIKVSAYQSPGKALLIVANTDVKAAHSAAITLDLKTLGVPSDCTITDIETGQPVQLVHGKIQTKLAARDVQYLLLVNRGLSSRQVPGIN